MSQSNTLTELLSKFDNGIELYQTNIIFNKCIEHLLRGGDIYKVLEQVLVLQIKTQEKLTESINELEIKSKNMETHMVKYKLHKFDKLPFGKYKNSNLNIANLVSVDFNYVLWFQNLKGVEYSKCIIDIIDSKKKILYEQKLDNIKFTKSGNKKLLKDDFLEYSGLEEAFRSSYFN